ncbi:MAG: hypothetical protein M0Z33_07470 [Actinomycetota bacterium]|nr:hypothetical protein [Actinomycetota bacterium]
MRRARASAFALVLLSLVGLPLAGPPRPSATPGRVVGSVAARSRAVAATAGPCGRTRSVPRYSHVVWIVMENNGFSQVVANRAAPFLGRLGRECGLATDYLAVAHPSLPNYLALTSGSTDQVTDDADPAAHPLLVPSIFSQLHGSWRALEEAMPRACDRVSAGEYAAKHDPAVYYVDLGATCARDVVPLRYPLDLSARFTFVTPDLCNDMHDCPVATGDAWLARVVGDVVASPEYRSGTTALFIVWDESESAGPNRVAAFVVAPSVPPGTRVAAPFTHYSLLATAEDLLGLARLGNARTARSMVVPFHL